MTEYSRFTLDRNNASICNALSERIIIKARRVNSRIKDESPRSLFIVKIMFRKVFEDVAII